MTRVLVTRPAAQAPALADALRRERLDPVCVPTVEIEPAVDPRLREALDELDRFDWLIVTSANAVPALAGRPASRTRIAAVGSITAAALERAGMRVDHVPRRFVGIEIAREIDDLRGRRVLLAQADAATPDLREALVERGARVTSVVAYRTVEAPPSSRRPLRDALDGGLDLLTFASPSAVRGLLRLLDPGRLEQARQIAAACIGPVTAQAAVTRGFVVSVMPERHTASDLARAIAQQLTETVA
ncbi:MAG TPA: uroporphyrinogen-III synthase [Candidatus Limnocylindria bacterium]|nr:uroporphyrinogen-III synthase [Candidatus Limnocylindria bacterium]